MEDKSDGRQNLRTVSIKYFIKASQIRFSDDIFVIKDSEKSDNNQTTSQGLARKNL